MSKVETVNSKRRSKRANPELVKVEDSMEEFILAALTRPSGSVPVVVPLWKSLDGERFRVMFYKYDRSSPIVSRSMVASSFVIVRDVDGVRNIEVR